MFAQHDLSVAVNRKGLQHHVEALAVLVRKCHADIEPVIVMLRSLLIEYPGRGYWARKAAGQKVTENTYATMTTF